MPALTFGPDCTYDMLDTILNNGTTSFKGFGLAVRIWLKQGVIITALWGRTGTDNGEHEDQTVVKAWSEKNQDYCKRMFIKTDDITRLEIL